MNTFVFLVLIFASAKSICHFTQNKTNLQRLKESEKYSDDAVQSQLEVLNKSSRFGDETIQKHVEVLQKVQRKDYIDQREVEVHNAMPRDLKDRKNYKARMKRDESSGNNEEQNVLQKLATLKQTALQNGVMVSNGMEEQAKLIVGTRSTVRVSQMLDDTLKASRGVISCDSVKIGYSFLSVFRNGLQTFTTGPVGQMFGFLLSTLLTFIDSPNCDGRENFENMIKTALERFHRDEIDEDINGLLKKLKNARQILTAHYANGINNYTESDLGYIFNGIPANVGLDGLGKIVKFLQEDAEEQRNVADAEQFLNRVSAYVNLKALRFCILSIKYQMFIQIRHMNKAFHVKSNLIVDLKSSENELRFLLRPKSAKGILVASVYDAEKWPNIYEYMKITKSIPEMYKVHFIFNILKMRFEKMICRPGFYISPCGIRGDGYTINWVTFTFEHQDGYPQNIRVKCVDIRQTYYEPGWWGKYKRKSNNYQPDTYISDVPCNGYHFLNYGDKWNLPLPLVRSKPDGYNLKLILIDDNKTAGFIVSRAKPDRFLNLYKKRHTVYHHSDNSKDNVGFYRFQNSARQIMYNPMVLEFYDGNTMMGKEYHHNVPDDSCDGHCSHLNKCDRQ